MLQYQSVYATIPVTDLEKSRSFYEKTLGLTMMEAMAGGIAFQTDAGAMLYIYQRAPSKADHTLVGFRVANILEAIKELKAKGVVFEHYDYPNLKTDANGIVETPPVKAAWFKDPDGNILGLTEHQ